MYRLSSHAEQSNDLVKDRDGERARGSGNARTGVPQAIRRLFLQNRSSRYKGDLLRPLCDLGLVRQEGKRFCSSYRVRLFRGLFIITDPFTLPESDRVFPLSEDESLFLAAHLHVKRGDVVLDVGTGSGIQALCAARRAKHVVATDVNGKALAYARFNAALNGLSAKVEFVRCDRLSEMRAERFDLIVTDPPVIPTPPGSHFFTHSDGGPFGTRVSRVVLRDGPDCLKAGGRMQMLCTALSNGNGKWPLLSDVHESDAFVPRVRELYPRSLALDNLLNQFRKVMAYDKWKATLAAQDLRRVHYLYIDVVPRNRVRSYPLPVQQQSIAKNNGSWGGRMRRLFLAYRGG